MVEQEQQTQQKSDWEDYEKARIGSLIKTQFDQKVYLLEVAQERIKFENLLSLVTKELSLSFINDIELKFLYQTQFENILEWSQMGLIPLAKIRLSKLFGELNLEKSVGGMERILQGSDLTGQVLATLPSSRGLFSPVRVDSQAQPTGEKKTLLQRAREGLSGGQSGGEV